MKTYRKYALLLLLLLIFTSAVPALAHANLLQANPAANARLDKAPVIIELFFSEPIEAGFSTIQVLDSSGKRVDNNDSTVDPGNPVRLTATVRSLPPGIYIISWRVLSSVDSHVTAGSYPFAIGNVEETALSAAAQNGRSLDFAPGEVPARWLTYLAAMALAGSSLFMLLVWRPVFSKQYAVFSKQTSLNSGHDLLLTDRYLLPTALLALLLAGIFWLMVQAGQVSGGGLAWPGQTAVTRVLFMTRFGALWAGRLVVAAVMWVLLKRPSTILNRWLFLAASMLLLLTLSLGSHAAAKPEPLLPVLADWLHLMAASVWVGGLFHFLAALLALRRWDGRERVQITAVLIPRFSALAVVSVSLLVLTGVYGSMVQVGSWAALTGTAYGRILLLKIAVFLPMLGLGALNLLVTSPKMKQAAASGSGGRVRPFRHLVTGEVGLGVLALLAASLLTAMPVPEPPDAAPAIKQTAAADDLEIALEVAPGRVGLNSFTVALAANGKPVEADEVALLFTPVTAGVPPSEVQLEAAGDGVYRVEGGYLAMPDAWQVQTAVRRTDHYDTFANFNVSVGTNTAVSAVRWHRITGGLLFVAGLVLLAGGWGTVRSGQTRTTQLTAVLLAAVGIFAFIRPPIVDENAILPNPIPPNADSIAAGKVLYLENCVPCHGLTGQGDGPVGITLNPRPADLTQHTAPGVHPDGRLYNWITDGVEGSVMPAFGSALSDEERWHVVNYIRTLNQP